MPSVPEGLADWKGSNVNGHKLHVVYGDGGRSVRAHCTNCGGRGRRGSVLIASAARSLDINNYIKRHQKHAELNVRNER